MAAKKRQTERKHKPNKPKYSRSAKTGADTEVLPGFIKGDIPFGKNLLFLPG
jgi:hypothetical protein